MRSNAVGVDANVNSSERDGDLEKPERQNKPFEIPSYKPTNFDVETAYYFRKTALRVSRCNCE